MQDSIANPAFLAARWRSQRRKFHYTTPPAFLSRAKLHKVSPYFFPKLHKGTLHKKIALSLVLTFAQN